MVERKPIDGEKVGSGKKTTQSKYIKVLGTPHTTIVGKHQTMYISKSSDNRNKYPRKRYVYKNLQNTSLNRKSKAKTQNPELIFPEGWGSNIRGHCKNLFL